MKSSGILLTATALLCLAHSACYERCSVSAHDSDLYETAIGMAFGCKSPETHMMAVAMSQSDLEVLASFPDTTSFGSDVVYRVELRNISDVTRTARIIMRVYAIVYTGAPICDVDSLDTLIDLDAGERKSVELVVTPEGYMEWTGQTECMEVLLSVRDLSGGEDHFEFERNALVMPPLKLVPSTKRPVEIGEVVTVEARWTNPSPYELNNLELRFSVGSHLALGGRCESMCRLDSLAPGESLYATEEVTALDSGSHYVSAVLWADELVGIHGYTPIVAYLDCNDNDVSDELDLAGGTSLDCNGNDVPDECDPDCNDSGIPDDCETRDKLVPDCNGNHLPDECDIASGTSQDVNGNGIPDECDPDCDRDGYSDYYEIHVLGASDGNRNGIPDICDYDCNQNGISDELDIATGTSADEDRDGVPDECQNSIIGAPMEASGGCGEVTITWIDDDLYYGEMGTYQLSRADTSPGPYSVLATIDWGDPSVTSDSTHYTYVDSTVMYSREYLYRLRVTSTGGQDTAWAAPRCLPAPVLREKSDPRR